MQGCCIVLAATAVTSAALVACKVADAAPLLLQVCVVHAVAAINERCLLLMLLLLLLLLVPAVCSRMLLRHMCLCIQLQLLVHHCKASVVLGTHVLLHWQLLVVLHACSCIGVFWLWAACQACGGDGNAAWHAADIGFSGVLQMLQVEALLLLLLLLLWLLLRFLPCLMGSWLHM
jgi:hypothetical protein